MPLNLIFMSLLLCFTNWVLTYYMFCIITAFIKIQKKKVNNKEEGVIQTTSRIF
ncbi:hypothetical protein BD770DRAFT_386093 [Pilaira anomala]|nr:hypothetical protein BD770DRAFT_386093 [Pilaira anomala]